MICDRKDILFVQIFLHSAFCPSTCSCLSVSAAMITLNATFTYLMGLSSDVLTPHYPWQSTDVSAGMLPPHHGNDFGLEPPGHNKENEDDVEAMSTDSSSSSSDSD